MKKLNSFITFKSAALSLLMMVLAVPAWAATVTYSGGSLIVGGTGKVTKDDVINSGVGWQNARYLEIQNGVTSIESGAFDRCDALETIFIAAGTTPLQCPENLFSDVSENATELQFLCYRNLDTDRYPMYPSKSGPFNGNSKLKEATLGGDMTYTPTHFFDGSGLSSINLSAATKLEKIDNDAFCNCPNLTQITIPNSVTSLGSQVFYNCTKLTSISIPNSVSVIPVNFLRGCTSLKSVTIPNSVTEIWIGAFRDCSSLSSITLPEGLTSIGEKAFYGCTGLTGITLPEEVVYINESAFEGCTGLTSITIPSKVFEIQAKAFYGCTNLARANFIGSPSIFGDNAFPSTTRKIYVNRSYEIWSSLNQTNATELYIDNDNIANYASFTTSNNLAKQFPNVKKVTFSPYVTAIGNYLFYNSATLETIVFEGDPVAVGLRSFQDCGKLATVGNGKVKSVDNHSFAGCTSLKSIEITDDDIIGPNAFQDCSALESVTFPSSLTAITNTAFANCTALKAVSFPANVETINPFAFRGCTALEKVTFGKNIRTIQSSAFGNCTALKQVTFMGSKDLLSAKYTATDNLATRFPNAETITLRLITSIGDYAFAGSSALKTIDNNSSVESIGTGAFANCTNLSSILQTYLLTIGANAFENCQSLTEFYVSDNITELKANTFKGCTGLKIMTLGTRLASIDKTAVEGCTNLTDLRIVSTPLASEKVWKVVDNRVEENLHTIFPNVTTLSFGPNISKVGAWAFHVNDGETSPLQKVTFQNTSGVDISWNAFENNTELTTVVGNVKNVDAYTFSGCSKLQDISLTGTESIEVFAFKGCTALTSITLPESLKTIRQTSFEGCTNLTDLTINGSNITPDNAEKEWTVNESLHKIFPNVTDLTFGPNVTKIGKFAFATFDTAKIKNITFQNVPTIGQSAFYGQTGLEQITGNINNVGESAFFQCSSLQSVAFSNDATEIGNAAFYWCSSLQSVALTDNVTKIGNVAFFNCSSLNSITLPNKLTTIGGNAFDGCTNLKSVTFNGSNITPDNEEKQWTSNYNFCTIFPYVERIAFAPAARLVASTAFSCGVNKNSHPLKSVRFWGITEVEKDAFYNQANLTTVEGRLKSAGECAFEGTSIESITFDDTYATPTIGNRAFADCSSLKTVKLSPRIETIGSMAFYNCTSLTEIAIPARVSEIQDLAFFNSGLNKVICHREEPISISTVVFDGYIMQRAELLVPVASIAAYKAAPVWQDFYKISASDAITITDGTAYTNDQDILVPAVRYTRTFKDTMVNKWQCLYVPFDLPVTEELLSDFEFAKLYLISQRDENNNGEIEDGEPLVMLISKFSAGKTLKANTPYFIKAKTAGTKNIEVNGTMLHAAASGYVDCSTTEHNYKLVGTNEPTLMRGKYGLAASGGFTYITSSTTKLGANRWYMEITSRTDGNPVYVSRPIEILVDGEDDATGIMDIRADRSSRSAEGIFTLDGRKISDTENLPSGIYIKNGKKVVIK